MKKRIVSFLLAVCMLSTVAAASGGPYNNYNNLNSEANRVMIAQAENNGETISGKGTTNAATDTRTKEEIEDDENAERIEELTQLIADLENQINAGQQGPSINIPGQEGDGSKLPDLTDPTVPGNPDLPDLDFPDWQLPDYELPDGENPDGSGLPDYELPDWDLPDMPGLSDLPDWVLPEFQLPDMPDFTLPEIDWDWYPEWNVDWVLPEFDPDEVFEDGEKAFDETYVIDGPTGSFIIRQFPANLGLLASYANQVGKMHENQTGELGDTPDIDVTYEEEDRGVINLIPELTLVVPEFPNFEIPDFEFPDYEMPEFDLPDFDFSDFEDWFKNWVKDHFGSLDGGESSAHEDEMEFPDWDLDDVIEFPDIDDVIDQFPGHVDQDTIPGTDVDVIIPETNEDLYVLLMRYIQELMSIGRNYANVTSITQYKTNEINVQTIRRSTPLAQYRWEITAENGNLMESTTTSPIIKLLFQSPGTYTVRVYNTQDVIRNTKVSGTKSEYWVLSNNDFFDGMVIYKNSSSFSGYVGQDIGPKEEEIELKKNGFIANITPEMVDKIQFMDTNGNIRTPADGFTTERN